MVVVTDLQTWAANLETVRLPTIETEQAALSAELASFTLNWSATLDLHTAQIDAANSSASSAIAASLATSADVYDHKLYLQTYVADRVQELRLEMQALIGGVNSYLTNDLLTYINAQVGTNLPSLTSVVDGNTATMQALRDEIALDMASAEAAVDALMNVTVPAHESALAALNQSALDAETLMNTMLQDLGAVNIRDGINISEATINDQLRSMTSHFIRPPHVAWITDGDSAVLDPKQPILPAWFVTNDNTFLDCAELPLAQDIRIGPAYPQELTETAIYRITVRLKVVQDGLAGVDLTIGARTWNDQLAGTSALEKVVATGLTISDGEQVLTAVFSRDSAKMTELGYALGSALTDDAMVLPEAGNQIFFWLRQNATGTTGQIRVKSFKVEDITSAASAEIFAAGAAASEASAEAYATAAFSHMSQAQTSATEAEQSATTANANRLLAETASANAQSYSDAALVSKTSAEDSASTATTQAGVATTASNSASGSATAASNSATAAAQSASNASGSASAATTSATLAASAQTASELRAAQTFPDNFNQDGAFWCEGEPNGFNPASVSAVRFRNNASGARVYFRSGFAVLAPKAFVPAIEGKVYELSVTFKVTVDSAVTGGTKERAVLSLRGYNAAGTGVAVYPSLSTGTGSKDPARVADGEVTLSGTYVVSAATAAACALLKPRFYMGYDASGNGNAEYEVSRYSIRDITESTNAESARAASEIARDDAVTAKVDAETAATSASSSLALSSRIVGQGNNVLLDQFLGTSSGWLSWASPPTWTTNTKYAQGREATSNLPAGSNGGIYTSSTDPAWVGIKDADAYVVEVDYTLNSGSMAAAGVLFDWDMTGQPDRRSQKSLLSMTPNTPVYGQMTTARGVFRKPSSATAAFEKNQVYVAAAYSGIAALTDPVSLTVHRVYIRSASAEEVGDGEVMATMTKTFRTSAQVDTAVSSGIASYDAAVPGGLSANVTQTATALADLEGFAAASASLTAELSNGKISGIRATVYDGAGGASSGSLLELIGDDVVAPGSLSTNSLNVGLNVNHVQDPEFGSGLSNWTYFTGGGSGSETSLNVRVPGSSWAGLTFPTLVLYQNGADTTGYAKARNLAQLSDGTTSNKILPVASGDWVEASAYISTHRCDGAVMIDWYDASGALISSVTVQTLDTNNTGSSTNPDAWKRYGGKAQAPSNATHCRMSIQKNGTVAGGSASSYVFIHKPMLAKTHVNATGLTPYSPSGTTYINGNRLITKTVTADHINVSSLSAVSATIGILRTATSGARMEIHSDKVLVYDATNTVRARIGNLA